MVDLFDGLFILVDGLPQVEGAQMVLLHVEMDTAKVIVIHGGHMFT